ncbi:hypothetical protein ACPSKX_14585 [Moritella viscosa]
MACITYTNVAVNEIKSRLGNSDAVQVSTIHERLWEIIKRAQPQLLICHKEKIEEVIEKNNQDLHNSTKAQFFNDLEQPKQQEFMEFALQTKKLFYQSKKLNAADFRNAYNDIEINKPHFLNDYLGNIGNFKFVISLIYKRQRLIDCSERIDTGEKKRVNYDSKVNSDRLHYMKFSHDTLSMD